MSASSSSTHHLKMTNDGLTIMFEHCTDQPYYPDPTSPSGRSSPATSAPSTPVDIFPHSPLDVAVASEDSWNLIPYDVPWGPEYYHYRAGTLPGPDGACIFLRSPTPLKNRRTQKACNKCRQRKAKCSGTRPTCTRCLARGYICEYVEEEKRVPIHHSTRHSRREHRQREGSTCSSEPAEGAYSTSDCESYQYTQAKSEEHEPSTPDLLYYDADPISYDSTSPTEYHPQWDDPQYTMSAPYVYDGAADSYCEPAIHDYYEAPSYPVADHVHPYHPHEASAMYHELPHQHPPSASVHAPRPVRCTGSPSFLAPEERIGAFAVPSEAQGMTQNPMLINLAAAAEPTPQIALPQVPPMAPTQPALEDPATEYAQPPGVFYYPHAEPVALQYPFLQYQYTVPTYVPGASQDGIEPAMLYSMPVLSAGMTA